MAKNDAELMRQALDLLNENASSDLDEGMFWNKFKRGLGLAFSNLLGNIGMDYKTFSQQLVVPVLKDWERHMRIMKTDYARVTWGLFHEYLKKNRIFPRLQLDQDTMGRRLTDADIDQILKDDRRVLSAIASKAKLGATAIPKSIAELKTKAPEIIGAANQQDPRAAAELISATLIEAALIHLYMEPDHVPAAPAQEPAKVAPEPQIPPAAPVVGVGEVVSALDTLRSTGMTNAEIKQVLQTLIGSRT